MFALEFPVGDLVTFTWYQRNKFPGIVVGRDDRVLFVFCAKTKQVIRVHETRLKSFIIDPDGDLQVW